MLDSQIIHILLREFIDGSSIIDIIRYLRNYSNQDYHYISYRCDKLVEKGILQTYKKSNTTMYRLQFGI